MKWCFVVPVTTNSDMICNNVKVNDTRHSVQIIRCEMITLLLEIWLKYLKYIPYSTKLWLIWRITFLLPNITLQIMHNDSRSARFAKVQNFHGD